MKKFYLPLLCMGLLSTTLFSQNTFVTGNATVKVQPNTLFYHGGNFTVKAAASDPSVIINSGNIKINGSFVNEVPEGKNFVSTYVDTPAESYGQVIINDDIATVLNSTQNMLSMEKKAINPLTSTWGQFAIPYQFTNVQTAHQKLFPNIAFVGAGSRYNHSVMTWDNMTRPEYDHIANGVVIKPTDYVILNLASGSPLEDYMGNGTDILTYSGTPANAMYDVKFRPTIYPNKPWDQWKNSQNIYREKYVTYIEEHLRVSTSPDFGRNYFQFGNPYTSNIDLSKIGTNATPGDTDGVYVKDLLGVVKIVGMYWEEDEGVDVAGVTHKRATYNSGTNTWGGDAEALIIKPFEGFYVGLTAAATQEERTFSFNDGLKTFSNTPALTPSGGVVLVGKTSDVETFSESPDSYDKMSQNLSLSSVSNRSSFYQLGLNLYTEENVKTGNVVYVIVDSNSQSGITQPLEAIYTDFYKGFFLTQENTDGSEVTTPNQVMQINTVHHKYVSKPIQLFFQTPENDYSGYYLKADLFYKNIFNKLKLEDGNYVDGNSFFFYDKVQDVLLPVTTDFSYYIERPEETQSSRYVVYWNGGPIDNKGKMEVADELAGTTQVYKDGDFHKIRFDENWSSADIAVYDLAGRSVFKEDNVKTDVDYVLDLPKTIVYVVKIQSNSGETVTQKIIR